MSKQKAQEILHPYVEKVFRHTEVVEKENALLAMQQYADKCNGIEWIAMKDQTPRPYERVIWFDSRDSAIHIGYFVWSQTPVPYATHWMNLPSIPAGGNQ